MKKVVLIVILAVGLLSKDIVILHTNSGDITLELNSTIAPKTVKNFLGLSKRGYYNGVVFHRVIKNFMIQSGDATNTGRGGESIYKKEFQDEFYPNIVFNKPFLLAMANHGPNTNLSQFFITTVPAYWLNGRHTIFGKVIDGFDVVKKIENSKVDRHNRPIVPQKIISVEIKQDPM